MDTTKQLISHLEGIITPERLVNFNKVLEDRTRYITVALEDIFQPQNASAVLRTCDCFGIQDVHIIENENDYNINPDVALGSYKWLDLKKYNEKENNTVIAINELKKKGYRVVATTPHTSDVSLPEFDLSKGKVALLFGTELNGLSDIAMENADEFLRIPMFGFTESFNISVSAALILHTLTNELRKTDLQWRLSDSEKDIVKLNWLQNSIKKPELIIEDFLLNKKSDTDNVISK